MHAFCLQRPGKSSPHCAPRQTRTAPGSRRCLPARVLCATLLVLATGPVAHAQAQDASRPAVGGGLKFLVELAGGVAAQPYSGRLWVAVNSGGRRDPLDAVGWFSKGPLYAVDVRDWKPGAAIEIDTGSCMAFGETARALPVGKYRAQAGIDLNRWHYDVLQAPGNGLGAAVGFEVTEGAAASVSLQITRVRPGWKLEDKDDLRYVRLPSRLLSGFYGHEVRQQAAVLLPHEYSAQTDRRFAAVYVVGGFGTDLRATYWAEIREGLFARGANAVVIFIDADCPTGHHVFADSANNGPVGTALIEELIPHLEKEFRLIPEPAARLVTGHSSGGWSSLWLQVRYPDTFGGCWSTSPDPVSFHAFQLIDIYAADANMYVDSEGKPAPVARAGPWGQLMTRPFCELEDVLGRGGQLGSFEAVFGPREKNGTPAKLWDRKTGRIDPAVAETWKEYDICLRLEREWPTLGPKLKGKLHLYCGDADSFFLDRAFFRLRDLLVRLGSDADVQVIEGASHMLPRAVYDKVYDQMAEAVKRADTASVHVPPANGR